MNKKTCFIIITFCILMLMFSLSVSAATSNALIETLIHQNAVSQSGANYASPFITPEGFVDTSTGAVNIVECDLSLPGKNGLDVNLYRK